jgi:hypothetical protein
VLRTNTDLDPLAAMLRYEQLWTVEQTFRTAKHLLSTRPIFHKLDETIRGQCSAASRAGAEESAGGPRRVARPYQLLVVIADLDSLAETEIEHYGKRFVVRSAPVPPPASPCARPASRCRQTVRESPG